MTSRFFKRPRLGLFLFICAIFPIVLSSCSSDDEINDDDGTIPPVTEKYSHLYTIDYSPIYHLGFTDLAIYNGQFYITYRQALIHGAVNGSKIIVQKSDDLEHWYKIREIVIPDLDLRGSHFIQSANSLFLHFSGRDAESSNSRRKMYYVDLINSPFTPNLIENDTNLDDWLWCVTAHQGSYYSVGYKINQPAYLYQTQNINQFRKIAEFRFQGKPTEATLRFQEDEAYMLMRRNDTTALLLNFNINTPDLYSTYDLPMTDYGGPNFIFYENYIIMGGRVERKTVLSTFDLTTNEFKHLVTLPSEGDNSYPGLAIVDQTLYVTYYSEDKPNEFSIKMATFNLNELFR